MTAAIIQPDGEDVLLRVKAVPGASRDALAGVLGDRLKVRISAPPEGGQANDAICRILAKTLGLKPRDVLIERGRGSPEKTIRLCNIDAARVRAALRIK